jgi:hypothetical protein
MPDDTRSELAHLWVEHLAAPFPQEWGELEEQFGLPNEREELQAIAGADRLKEAWGDRGFDVKLVKASFGAMVPRGCIQKQKGPVSIPAPFFDSQDVRARRIESGRCTCHAARLA